jgi:hypothetical protein
MSERTAYPLSWPAGWPKTEPYSRGTPRFQTDLPRALANLKKQIELMGGKSLVLSSNYTLGANNPKEPGVVAYFEWQQIPMAIPCDRWSRIEANVQAIALTVEAMRGMERWGAKHMIKAMFSGFKALPQSTDGDWWTVLGVSRGSSPELVKAAYRELVKRHHPDAGGNAETFRRVQAAYEQFERS